MPKWNYNQPAFAAVGEGMAQNGLTKLEYAAIHIFAARTTNGLPEFDTEATIASDCVNDALVLFEQLQIDDEDTTEPEGEEHG